MAYPVVIEDAEKKAKLTLNGTVVRGNLIADNGTGWVQADASDATINLYAQYVALNSGVSGDEIKGCKSCVLYDEDAPYTTASAPIYLSATAGAFTETRPTTNADVIQNVGNVISTKRVKIDIGHLRELEVFIPPCTYDSTAEPGLGVIDSPVWVGAAIDTTGGAVYFQGRIPSNAIGLNLARVVWNSIGETTITLTGTIIVAADGATNTGDTGTAFSAAAPTALADNYMCYSAITACFDADAFKAGYNFTVVMTESGASAGNLQAIGLYMRYAVV